jgi:hypothetical protein
MYMTIQVNVSVECRAHVQYTRMSVWHFYRAQYGMLSPYKQSVSVVTKTTFNEDEWVQKKERSSSKMNLFTELKVKMRIASH